MPQCLSREQRQKRREELLKEKYRIQKVMKENRNKYNGLLASFDRSPRPASPQPPPPALQIKCNPNRNDLKKAAQQQPFVMPPRKEHNLVNRMLAEQERNEKQNCMMGTRQIHQNIKAFEEFNAPRKHKEPHGKCRKCDAPLPYAGNIRRPDLDEARKAIVRGNNKPIIKKQQRGAAQQQPKPGKAEQEECNRGFDIGDIDFYEDQEQNFDMNDIFDYELEPTCEVQDDDNPENPNENVDINDIYNYEFDVSAGPYEARSEPVRQINNNNCRNPVRSARH